MKTIRRVYERMKGVRPVANCIAAAVALAMLGGVGCVTTSMASADDAETIAVPGADVVTRAFSDNTKQTVSNPAGTTINFFDYWNSKESEIALQLKTDSIKNGKINKGSALKFFTGKGQVDNQQTGGVNQAGNGTSLHQGIVESSLDADGFPKLTRSTTLGTDGKSLNYLFDPDTKTYEDKGRRTYANVDGLLQVDADGYHYYDAREDFAHLTTDADGRNVFKVYDQPFNVGPSSGKRHGEFFPTMSLKNYNTYARKGVNNDAAVLPSWFGLSMTTRFTQPAGGKVTDQNGVSKPMTYEFSGDDDVWIFVDGKLVADLGGTHAEVGVSIDFSTGRITYKDGNGQQLNDGKYDTTLKTMLGLPADTLEDGSEHTLNFYYLERGAHDSNLKIRYNLAVAGDFTAHKSLVRTSANQPALKKDQFTYRLTGSYADDGSRPLMPGGSENCADTARTCTVETGNEANGDVHFGDVSAHAGHKGKTYRYVMEELGPDQQHPVGAGNAASIQGNDTITYDATKYYFTIMVQDSDEGLRLVKTYYTDDTYETVKTVSTPQFTNYYSGADARLQVTKRVNGAIPGSEYTNSFKFTVTPQQDAPAPAGSDNATNGENGTVAFNPIAFKPSDLDAGATCRDVGGHEVCTKTFTYTITENDLSGDLPSNMVKDPKTVTAEVKVDYDRTVGTLAVAIAYTDDDNTAGNDTVFNNTVKSVTVESSITVAKRIEGRAWQQGDSFRFGVRRVTDDPRADGYQPIAAASQDPLPETSDDIRITNGTEQTVRDDGGQTYRAIDLGSLTFSEPGSYIYELSETTPDPDERLAAMKYDTSKTYIQYCVIEDPAASAGLKAWANYRGSFEDAAGATCDGDRIPPSGSRIATAYFTNIYSPVSALPLTGGSTGREWLLAAGGLGGLALLVACAAGVWNGVRRLV